MILDFFCSRMIVPYTPFIEKTSTWCTSINLILVFWKKHWVKNIYTPTCSIERCWKFQNLSPERRLMYNGRVIQWVFFFCQWSLWWIAVRRKKSHTVGAWDPFIYRAEFLAASTLDLPVNGMLSSRVCVCVFAHVWSLVPQWGLLCRCVCLVMLTRVVLIMDVCVVGGLCGGLFILPWAASRGTFKGRRSQNTFWKTHTKYVSKLMVCPPLQAEFVNMSTQASLNSKLFVYVLVTCHAKLIEPLKREFSCFLNTLIETIHLT